MQPQSFRAIFLKMNVSAYRVNRGEKESVLYENEKNSCDYDGTAACDRALCMRKGGKKQSI